MTYATPLPRGPVATDRPDETLLKQGHYDDVLEDVGKSLGRRMSGILAKANSEGRGFGELLASEQREFEDAAKTLKTVGARAQTLLALDRSEYNERRTEHEIRARQEADVRMQYPALFGGGSSAAPRDVLGERLANAVDDVRAGKTATAIVELPGLRNDLSTGGDWGQGVPIEFGPTQQTLKARSVIMSLPGIRTVPMSSGQLRFPRIDDDTTHGIAELEAATESDPDLDAVTLTAGKFISYNEISEELEQDFSAEAMSVLSANMLKSLALKLDHEMLEGDGSNGIVGLRSWPGINTTAVDAEPTSFAKFREVEYELAAADGDLESAAWLMHPRTWKVLSDIKTGISSDETTLLQPDPQRGPRTLLGYNVLQSTQITLTEGGGAGSWAGLVDGSQLVIGERMSPRFEISRDLKFNEGIIAMRAVARYGFAVINPGAVSIATDIRDS